MRSPILAAVAVLLLSGCVSSGSTSSTTADPFSGVTGEGNTRGIRGIVVDQAIVPVAKVAVTLELAAGNRTATTDAQGRFLFGDLPAGTYFLTFKHLLYKTARSSVELKEGVEPPITRVQLEALFTAKPYHEQFKFKGIIACGYEAVLISAPCVTDYSSISPTCPGGCAPALRSVQGDNRAFTSSVGPNWQTMVVELLFQSNGQGTSDRMGVLLSYEARTASDWFAVESGTSPVLLRLESGVKHPTQQGEPELLDPAGRNDLQLLGSVRSAEGQDAGAGINQEFQVFQTNFYNAKPPEAWSFANGDEFPF
jgi:hypothetical protein